MGAFKVGDRVKVADRAFTEYGMSGVVLIPSAPGVTYNRIQFDTANLSGFNDHFLDRELALTAPKPGAPVRRPKGRFTVRQGQTLREAVNRLDAYPLSSTRWYPR